MPSTLGFTKPWGALCSGSLFAAVAGLSAAGCSSSDGSNLGQSPFAICVLKSLSASDGCASNNAVPLGNRYIGDTVSAIVDVTCGNKVSSVEIKELGLTRIDGTALADENFQLALFTLDAAGSEIPAKLPFVLNSTGKNTELRAHLTFTANRPIGSIDVASGPAVRIASATLAVTLPIQGSVTGCPPDRGDCDDNPNDCETDLNTSVLNCGKCKNVSAAADCLVTRDQAICVKGSCTNCAGEATTDDTCDSANAGISVGIGQAVKREGTIAPLGEVDYYAVTFANQGDCANFRPRITLDNPGVLFDVFESTNQPDKGITCSQNNVACGSGESASSVGLREWKTACSDPTENKTAYYDYTSVGVFTSHQTTIGTTFYVKVRAAWPKIKTPSCLPYTITFSNNYTSP